MRTLLIFLVVLALSCTAIGLEMWAIVTVVNIRKCKCQSFHMAVHMAAIRAFLVFPRGAATAREPRTVSGSELPLAA